MYWWLWENNVCTKHDNPLFIHLSWNKPIQLKDDVKCVHLYFNKNNSLNYTMKTMYEHYPCLGSDHAINPVIVLSSYHHWDHKVTIITCHRIRYQQMWIVTQIWLNQQNNDNAFDNNNVWQVLFQITLHKFYYCI